MYVEVKFEIDRNTLSTLLVLADYLDLSLGEFIQDYLEWEYDEIDGLRSKNNVYWLFLIRSRHLAIDGFSRESIRRQLAIFSIIIPERISKIAKLRIKVKGSENIATPIIKVPIAPIEVQII